MIDVKKVKPNMNIVGSDNREFGVVDHLEGEASIKVKKDNSGQHHYIPLSWVASVDDKIHLDRPLERAQRDWKTSP